MTNKEIKEFVRHIYDEVSKGNHQVFLDAVTDDFTFTLIGTTRFSGTYRGIPEM